MWIDFKSNYVILHKKWTLDSHAQATELSHSLIHPTETEVKPPQHVLKTSSHIHDERQKNGHFLNNNSGLGMVC